MWAFRKLTIGLTLSAAIGLGAAWLLGVDAQNPPVAKCYLGHLSTDKPIYRSGEVVFLRSVVLGALDHQPVIDGAGGGVSLQITGPRGEQIFNQWSMLQDSVSAFAWNIPPDTSGGQYSAKVSFPSLGYPPAERKFEIRAYRAPRLKGEIVFLRDGFGAGDTVKASLHVERAEGGLPVGSTVAATADVDGATVYSGVTTIDQAGNCAVQFPLPGKIAVGDGTLSLAVTDGGVVEPITKTIPILVNSINLSIYPEGGDLIAGLPNRVYIEWRTPSQKPADISAVVVDVKGKIVAELKTEHEGRGRFDITPEAGAAYSIRILQPSGIHHEYRLPEAKAEGVVIHSEADVTPPDAPIKLDLAAVKPGRYTVVLSKRQTEAASTVVDLTSQMSSVSLTPPRWADGVLIATVKQADGTPVAERLVYRDAGRSLHVKVTPDRTGYVPGDAVSVTVATTDDEGHPVAAVVGVTATDQSVLQMIEKRARSPHLPAMVMLEDDVKELADAEIYLDRNDPKSGMATDLLLGTQGWRRFALANTVGFLSKEGDLGRRVLADLQPVMMFNGAFGGRGGGGGVVFDAMPIAGAAPEGVVLANKAVAEEKHVDKAAAQNARRRPVNAKQEVADQAQLRRLVPADMPMMPPTVVREYAHQVRSDRAADDRTDFAETVYWSAGIKTDEKTGTANVKFNLSDSVTSFDITADAFDAAGRLGQATANITANQPFYIEPKLPLEVTSGDVIHLPLAAVNATTQPADQMKLTITAGDNITVGPVDPFNLGAGQRLRRTIDLKVGDKPGSSDFAIWAHNDLFSDRVTRTLVVKPMGFPTEITNGGTVAAKSKVVHEIVIPDSVIAGSMTANATLYPTPLANLTEALQRLLQEPYGCFEQTSSTTYPLVMADQYFNSHAGVDPALIARSNDLLQKGYDRLKGFECSKKGYEWFGEDPGHECLTAYGLMEFTDMSAVRNVDGGMLANTRKWLLARRDGKGGYSHERRSLHTWIVDPGCANGYCTWALLETGEKGIDKEVDWLRADATSESNSYVKALAANVLFLAGDRSGAKQFMDQLAGLQDADGHVKGATTTVVGSGGESLEIETTSLATLAWLRDPAYAGNVEAAIRYLADSCKGGRFGSTQSTVLALRAIIAYDKARAHPTAAGNIQLLVDNEPVGEPIPFDAGTTGAIKLPDFSSRLNPGKHAVELRMGDGSDLPYFIAVTFNSVTPASADQCKLAMTTTLVEPSLAEGAVSEVKVSVTNKTGDTLPTPIAIIGLPGGLEVRHDQLKELVKAERIAAYEVRGREVILYWRDIQPNQTIELPISVTAAIPGEYTGPASRVYLYYTDEFKQWLPGLKAVVR
jgi:hypothetical protein